jgi:hypothetical protein
MFEDSKISWLLFIIIVIAAIVVLFCAAAYMVWCYHLGKPLAPFFWLRLKGWTTKNVALFEIFSLTNGVSLEEARKETGDGYRLFTPTTIKVPVAKKAGKFQKLINYMSGKTGETTYEVKRVKRIQNLIMPKSTYSINGVNTIPLWDLHPQLHADLIEGVKILVENGISTLEDLTEFVTDKQQAELILFKNYSYRTFLDLYLGVRQKYNVSVTTNDVSNFIGKEFDKNYRESIEAKDFNAMQKGKTDSKLMYYGYAAILLTILIVGFKVIYTTIYK